MVIRKTKRLPHDMHRTKFPSLDEIYRDRTDSCGVWLVPMTRRF